MTGEIVNIAIYVLGWCISFLRFCSGPIASLLFSIGGEGGGAQGLERAQGSSRQIYKSTIGALFRGKGKTMKFGRPALNATLSHGVCVTYATFIPLLMHQPNSSRLRRNDD